MACFIGRSLFYFLLLVPAAAGIDIRLGSTGEVTRADRQYRAAQKIFKRSFFVFRYGKITYLIIIFHLILPRFLYPQPEVHQTPAYEKIMKFEHLSPDDGLSAIQIFCIFQDKQGFLWFGTENGLNRYDGYEFKIFQYVFDDSTSVSHNVIASIVEDHSGTLWVATGYAGINKFDRDTGKFIRFKHDPANPNSISGNYVTSMCLDHSGFLWVGTRSVGLNKLLLKEAEENNNGKLSFQRFTNDPLNTNSISNNSIRTLYVDKAGVLWIGTKFGLNRFDHETESFTNYLTNPKESMDSGYNDVTAIHEDNSGILWVGTLNGGLYKFDRDRQEFIQPIPGFPLHISSITQDHTGMLWVGTDFGDGLYTINPKNYDVFLYQHNQFDPNSVSDNFIHALFVDRAGILWIGTRNGGINKLDLKKQEFKHLYHALNKPYSLSSNFIWSIFEDRTGKIWIGTAKTGIDLFDPETGKMENLSVPSAISKNARWQGTREIYEDKSGIIWLGTAGGLCRFDEKNQQIVHYREFLKNPKNAQFVSYPIRSLLEDRFGIFWIGTERGLFEFNRVSEKFVLYANDPNDPNSIGGNYIHCLYEDRDGIVWAGGEGLNKFDREIKKFTRYERDPKNPKSMSDNFVGAICEDKRGNLWLTSVNGGLKRFNKTREVFTTFSIRDGLPSDVISSVLEDNAGNLWLSTGNGVSRFNPEKIIFKNFDTRDGAQGKEFCADAYSKGRSGRFYFGGVNGLNIFYPDSVKDNPFPPPVVITDFRLFNKTALPGKDSPIKKSIAETEEIELSYKDYIFSFHFVALDYSIPEKNLYAYKMDGVDPDWTYTNASQRFATYTNLDPGTYIFRVKASNNDGIWNEQGTSVKVIIAPPWWKTWWAYTFYAFFFVVALYSIRRYELHRQRLKYQLELEHIHAGKLAEIDRMKSHFFANISHEFRTPLTLILGPLEQLIKEARQSDLKQQYQVMRRNAQRLLNLINQLLELSKLESGSMKLQARYLNVVSLLRRIVYSFISLGERKHISLAFNADEDTILAYCDQDKIEKIMNNLLSNAFNFTLENGTIIVNVAARRENLPAELFSKFKQGYVEIAVADTGSGIPAEVIDKIFDRFYQVDASQRREYEGTGIGLSLTKELVELHHGEIFAQSEEGKGSTFIVRLPLGKAHLQAEEILETDVAEQEQAEADTRDPVATDLEEILPSEVFADEKKNKRIKSAPVLLIVEDNQDMRSYLHSFLSPAYRVIEAGDGQDGLKKALRLIPDLIISDVMMPQMDGIELCNQLKTDERTSHIPIILLTARASVENRISGLETGADDYIAKPFDARELQVRAQNLIEQRRKLRERFRKEGTLQPRNNKLPSRDEQFLQKAKEVVEKHISDEAFSVERFGKEIGMSRVQLHRKLKALTDHSASDFIRTLRLNRAAQLLAQQSSNVTEVAFQVGFNNLSYFAKCFHQQFGQSPSAYAAGISKNTSQE